MGNLMGNQTCFPTAGQSASRLSHLPPKGEVGKVEGSPGNSRFPMNFPFDGKWEREKGKTSVRSKNRMNETKPMHPEQTWSPSAAAKLLSLDCEPMPGSSGQQATVEPMAIGADRCTDCMLGQGDDCHCRQPVDARAMRWLVLGLVAFWSVIAYLVRAFMA